ncbi:GNAT family N-acetyltransferase [Leptolyngbya sp. FACHB-261]|uniref:GNAT family N-acetyltransferase n=1 Tax=Leptolyngbya sp. FACHB-261 TaxID=2692806 RepID=UPI001684EE1D|nr:GNAT family N-acetyltransferase [Leptolyngbya sp. FACHB-261]MBD2099403.1 GNAT family N-acetyltransferase [Leptolyngbya sp. FACHB-261]
MQVEITTWYLEMLAASELRPALTAKDKLSVMQAEVPLPELNRFFYTAIGGDWYWLDRLSWTYQRWLDYLSRPEVQTWVAYLSGTPAGYIELEAQPNHNVEIAYFGILKPFVGQRIGGHLLSIGIQQAWAMGAKRLWVHTCSLDGPHALRNYQARGFRLYQEKVWAEDIPEKAPGPWPGAY